MAISTQAAAESRTVTLSIDGQEVTAPEGRRSGEAGVSMGSGVVMVVDDSVDLPAILMRIAAFFRDESCGQCVPCRVGTVRQEEALARLADGHPRGTQEQEYALLDEIALLVIRARERWRELKGVGG